MYKGKSFSRHFRRFRLTYVWGLIIMILTAIPGQMIPRVQGFLDLFAPDKLVHLFIFGLLQWLLLKESGNGEKETRKDNIATTLIVSLGYAALTELLQWKLFINRQGSVW
ncbi:MAG: VanZ family protein, partial [Bacteroidales bacterium]|nr:VanZ family protein [Bacteroidales bacterium]